jgi:hypothetical protein
MNLVNIDSIKQPEYFRAVKCSLEELEVDIKSCFRGGFMEAKKAKSSKRDKKFLPPFAFFSSL